jgi:outer membrane protein assembly factor BamB
MRTGNSKPRDRFSANFRWIVGGFVSFFVLVVASCGERKVEALVESGVVEDASWQTQAWPMTRGGLQGRVSDRVPRRPQLEWSFPAGAPVTSEVVMAEGVMVFGDDEGVIHAVDLGKRGERWLVKTDDTVEAAPAVSGGRVFVGSNDGTFRALDLADGRELWRVKGGEKFPTGAVLVPAQDGVGERVLVNGYDGVSLCLGSKDGREIWRHETGDYINGSPVPLDGGLLVFGGCDAVIHGISLVDGDERFSYLSDAQIIRSVSSWEGVVFAVNHADQLLAVDLRAGKPVWVRESDGSSFLTIPAMDGEKVYIGSRDKHLHAFGQSDGTATWSFRAGARVESSALVFDDAVVFGSADGRLYAVDKKDGSEIWRLDLGEALPNAPSFACGRIVIGGEGGTVFVVREGGGKAMP